MASLVEHEWKKWSCYCSSEWDWAADALVECQEVKVYGGLSMPTYTHAHQKKKGENINGNDSSSKKKCSFENVDRKIKKTFCFKELVWSVRISISIL